MVEYAVLRHHKDTQRRQTVQGVWVELRYVGADDEAFRLLLIGESEFGY